MNFEVTSEIRPALTGFAVCTATPEQQGCAIRLVDRCYADLGYVNSAKSTQPEEALTICSAYLGQRTVGTIGVRFESPRGLNADAVFSAELAGFRSAGMRVCEFSRLAVDPDARENKPVLARLFHLAYLHAHRLAGCELLVIEVNPRHVAFYRRMLGFKVRSEPRLNPRVNAEAVLMTLDLRWASEQIARFGGQPSLASTTRTLLPYFYAPDEEAAMLAKLIQ